MAKFMLLITATVFMLHGGGVNSKIIEEGWFWRDFEGNGTIPDDALVGGRDAAGNPIYIGQILYNGNLIPARIYRNDRKGYFTVDGESHSSRLNVKILCTDNPELFTWVATSPSAIKTISNLHLVSGGFQPYHTTYIGRKQQGSELTIGKVMVNGNDASIWTSSDDLELNNKDSPYEVLAYDYLRANSLSTT